MLKLKYLFDNYDLAKQALTLWEHDQENLDDTLKHFRISANAIYPFKQKGKLCFLRLAPTEEKRLENIVAELDYLKYLQERSYPSLQAIPTRDGEYVKEIETQWGAYYASAFYGVSGIPIEDSKYTKAIMTEYGKALGRLHTFSREYKPKRLTWSYEQALEWIENVFASYLAPDFMVGELQNVRAQLKGLCKDSYSFGLVHYDFEPDNVFYDVKNKQCNAIDFEDCMYHFYVLDIEQVFDSLDSELDWDKAEKAKAEFILGYKQESVLDEDYQSKLPLMRRFIDLFSYARLIRCVDEMFDDEPDWLVGLRKKLNYVIDNLEKEIEKRSQK